MNNDELYTLLRNFTSPVVAITSGSDDEANGMIANSAIRASLVPECPRLAFYCFKDHYSHDLIPEYGSFCLHLLQRNQLELVRTLGFESGRNTEKFSNVDYTVSERGLPILSDVYAYFECEVVNAMDAGPSTFFLGDVVNADRGSDYEAKTPLDSQYLRSNMPEDWQEDYRKNKKEVQRWARDHLDVDPSQSWPEDY